MRKVPTDEQIEELRAYKRTPTRQELERIFSWFFSGPVGNDVVDRLEQQLAVLLDDNPRRMAIADQFTGNIVRYEGERWKELVSNHRLPPSRAELAIWLARTTPGYPPARPYCPIELVGRWRQIAPTAALWDSREDGTVSTDDERYRAKDRWCVMRRGKATFANMMLTLSQGIDSAALRLRPVTPTSWSGSHAGLDGPVEYVFERIF